MFSHFFVLEKNNSLIFSNLYNHHTHRASLVPVISFGENELYQTMHHEEMTLGRKIQEKLLKLLTFTPPLFFGMFNRLID